MIRLDDWDLYKIMLTSQKQLLQEILIMIILQRHFLQETSIIVTLQRYFLQTKEQMGVSTHCEILFF
jgi:hypothetical protein